MKNLSFVECCLPKEIARTELVTRKGFNRNYASVGTPVIITNSMNQWRAFSLWNFEWFKNTHGAVTVPISFGKLDYSRKFKVRQMTIVEYIKSIFSKKSADKGYMGSINLLELIPSLAEDIAFPKYYWSNRFTRVNF